MVARCHERTRNRHYFGMYITLPTNTIYCTFSNASAPPSAGRFSRFPLILVCVCEEGSRMAAARPFCVIGNSIAPTCLLHLTAIRWSVNEFNCLGKKLLTVSAFDAQNMNNTARILNVRQSSANVALPMRPFGEEHISQYPDAVRTPPHLIGIKAGRVLVHISHISKRHRPKRALRLNAAVTIPALPPGPTTLPPPHNKVSCVCDY